MTNAAENADLPAAGRDARSEVGAQLRSAAGRMNTQSKIARSAGRDGCAGLQKVAEVQPMQPIDTMAQHDAAWWSSSEVQPM
jgi:hypothetical protein